MTETAWTCATCHNHGWGNFCPNCGAAQPTISEQKTYNKEPTKPANDTLVRLGERAREALDIENAARMAIGLKPLVWYSSDVEKCICMLARRDRAEAIFETKSQQKIALWRMKDSFLFSIMQRELVRLSDKNERYESQHMELLTLVQDTLNSNKHKPTDDKSNISDPCPHDQGCVPSKL